MSDPFVHLHVHSEYSFLDGYGHPADFVSRAKELGQTALAITDHGNVSAHKRWNDACVKNGIKPILGVEAYITDEATKKDNEHKHRWHITILAKNAVGYRNLMRLVTRSWVDGFYYKPRTDWASLGELSEGLVVTSGCPSGRIGRGILRDHWTDETVAKELKRQAALVKDYYVELSPWTFPEGVALARQVYRVAKAEGLPMVLTMDAHYPRPTDAHMQDVILCVQNKTRFSDPNRMKFSQDDFCLWSGNDMAVKWMEIHRKHAPLTEEMLENTRRIADTVDFVFPKATPIRFEHQGDKVALLREMCERGMVAKGLVNKPGYRERLEYEFGLVVSKDFVDYFLVVADVINWAKGIGILVGPARGSSCGSLMCYLTRITEIDPLRFNLLFERFIDVTRADPPDIDIDFESVRRAEVKTYLEQKYGADKVANLPTFGTYKGRSCIEDIGRVFADRIPPEAVEETKRLIIQRSSADSRAGFAIEDTFANFEQAAEWLRKYPELGLAKQLEGKVRQLGVHAAGIVISNEPIEDFAAVYVTSKGDRVISMDYYDANAIGLLKIDVLGLTALTAIKRMLRLIKQRHGVEPDLLSLSLDDKAVYDAFCQGRLEGIFQFDGAATKQVNRQVKPENFDQLTAINALSRPGPLHSGGTTMFIARRHGLEPVAPLHPMLEHITSSTYGITVYQEQVMQVVREMGKFSWKDTAQIRKAMSKKFGNEFFDRMKAMFVDGAASQGVKTDEAIAVWQNVCTFGSWAFNKSHSVAYTLMAYQLMWLKVHYPEEFYSEMIDCEEEPDVRKAILREYKRHGGKVHPVCINRSGLGVAACDNGGLRLGLGAVVGLSDKQRESIRAKAPYRDWIDFKKRCKLPEARADALLRIGAFRDLECDALTEQMDLFGAHSTKTKELDYQKPSDTDVMEHCPLAAEDKVIARWRKWVQAHITDNLSTIDDLSRITSKTNVLIIGTTDTTKFNLKNKLEEALSRGHEYERREDEMEMTDQEFNFLNFLMDDGTSAINIRISHKQYPVYENMIWKTKASDVLAVRGMCNGVMWMVFSHAIVNLTQLRRKLEAKERLTPEELAFLNPARRSRERSDP